MDVRKKLPRSPLGKDPLLELSSETRRDHDLDLWKLLLKGTRLHHVGGAPVINVELSFSIPSFDGLCPIRLPARFFTSDQKI